MKFWLKSQFPYDTLSHCGTSDDCDANEGNDANIWEVKYRHNRHSCHLHRMEEKDSAGYTKGVSYEVASRELVRQVPGNSTAGCGLSLGDTPKTPMKKGDDKHQEQTS